jgi:hypothetical protein
MPHNDTWDEGSVFWAYLTQQPPTQVEYDRTKNLMAMMKFGTVG